VKRQLLIGFILLLGTSSTFSQNLNGFWKGNLTFQSSSCFPQNNLELQISINGNIVTGDSYHYLDINNYVKKKLSGIYNGKMISLSIQEGVVTTFKIPSTCSVCIKHYQLSYSKDGDTETLSGTWTGIIMEKGTPCEPGEITLTRTKESAFKEIPEVKVDTGRIRLDLYDNGHIDGDSISVLVNKKVVVAHQLLGVKPITVYLQVDPQNPFHEIEMVAENLGSIPPNTALLIVNAGDKNFRLQLSSTEEKSAVVRFVYEPPYTFPISTIAKFLVLMEIYKHL
jgi:hypothetical protein